MSLTRFETDSATVIYIIGRNLTGQGRPAGQALNAPDVSEYLRGVDLALPHSTPLDALNRDEPATTPPVSSLILSIPRQPDNLQIQVFATRGTVSVSDIVLSLQGLWTEALPRNAVINDIYRGPDGGLYARISYMYASPTIWSLRHGCLSDCYP